LWTTEKAEQEAEVAAAMVRTETIFMVVVGEIIVTCVYAVVTSLCYPKVRDALRAARVVIQWDMRACATPGINNENLMND
jgi:hypothetical protein